MLKSARVRLVALFVVVLTVSVLSIVQIGGDAKTGGGTSKSPVSPEAAQITATMTSSLVTTGCPGGPSTTDLTCNNLVNPGDTIRYAVTITNTGDAAATGVSFSDAIDNTTSSLVNGSTIISPVASTDTFPVTGNVRISSANSGSLNLLANDRRLPAGDATNLVVTAETKKSTACTAAGAACSANNVTIAADGTFTYNPPPGFEGTGAQADTFTYTVTDTTPGNGLTNTGTVKLDVSGMIWFVDESASAGGDGRLSNPFNCFGGAGCFGSSSLDEANDNIFLYKSGAPAGAAFNGGVTLLNGQRLIGQGASATLATITGITPAAGSDTLPATAGINPTVTTLNINNITLGSGNTIRGITIGNSGTGTKLTGTSFGTLTLGDSTTPDVTLSGSGRAFNLTTGTFAATSALSSVAVTASPDQGMFLSAVGGTLAMGSTTISGHTIQCITLQNSTASVSFGNTSCTGGGEGVLLSNNTAGVRTFGTLSTSGGSGNAFIHSSGGGDTTITGVASLSTAGNAISVSAPASGDLIDFQAATTATTTVVNVTGISWSGAAGAEIKFSSLTVNRNQGTAINATGGGAFTVSTNAGSITSTTAGGPAIVANGVALNTAFSQINSTAGTNGVSLTNVTGSSNFGSGNLTGSAAGATFLVSGGTVNTTYAGTMNQAAAQALIAVSGGHSGTLTFNTGLLQASGGTGVQFDDADGTYAFNGQLSLNGGDAGVDILNGSAGTFTFASNNSISNPSGIPFNINGGAGGATANVTYNGAITKTSAPTAAAINVTNHSGGTVTFQTGGITASIGTGLQFSNADGTYTVTGFTMNSANVGDAGIDILSGSSGTFTLAGGVIDPTGTAYTESSSNPTVTFGGLINKTNNAASAISISSKTGGSTTFDAPITASTSTATAITMGATGGTITFRGGLDITTTSGTAFNATGNGGATLNVCDETPCAAASTGPLVNSIATSTGRAINIDGVTANVTLRRVDVAGEGTTTGVFLKNTGAAGRFIVTGVSSTAGSGGAIADIGGADVGTISGAPATGTGMYLENVENVTLSNMIFGSTAAGDDLMSNFAIRGNNVNNFTLRDSEFRGAFGNNPNFDEGTIRFGSQNVETGLRGTGLFEGNSIGGGNEDNLGVYVYGNNTLNITIKDNAASGDVAVFPKDYQNGNDAFFLESGGTSNVTVNVTGVDFFGAKGDLIQLGSKDATTQTSVIQNNQFINQHTAIISGGGGLTINGGGTAPTVDYLITGNTFKGMRASAIFSSFGGHPVTNPMGQPTAGGNISGLITNNTMGTDNNTYDTSQAARGSMEGMFFFGGIDAKQLGSTGDVNYALRIEGNTIRDLNGQAGILLRSAQQDQNGQARVEATIKNNTMAEFGPGVFAGILGQPGGSALNDDKGTMGLDIINNDINFSVGGTMADAVYFDKVCLLATHYMPGYTSAPSATPSTLAAFLTGTKNNTFVNAAVSGGNGVGTNSTTSVANQTFVLAIPSAADPADALATAQTESLGHRQNVIETLGGMAAVSHEIALPFGTKASIVGNSVSELGAVGSLTITVAEEIIGGKPSRLDILAGLVEFTRSFAAPTAYAQEPEGTGGTVNATIGTLVPGTSVTIYYDVQLDPVGTLPANVFAVSNTATVTADGGISVTTDGDGNSGNGQQANVVNVIQPEVISKAFSPSSIQVSSGVSTLTFTIANNNPVGPGANATQIAFTDPFPANLVLANGTTTNTCGGTFTDNNDATITAGDQGVKLVGGALNASAGGATCAITVQVASSVGGDYPNTTTAISSLEGATGLTSNTAVLRVYTQTAATASVSGRVLTVDGRGVTNARVTITGQDGVSRTVTTGRGGAFTFDDVPTGSTYTIAVVSQRFRFDPQVVAVTDQVTGLTFTASR